MTEQQCKIGMVVSGLLLSAALWVAGGFWIAAAGYWGSNVVVLSTYYIVAAIRESSRT